MKPIDEMIQTGKVAISKIKPFITDGSSIEVQLKSPNLDIGNNKDNQELPLAKYPVDFGMNMDGSYGDTLFPSWEALALPETETKSNIIDEDLQTWQLVWRKGFLPSISTIGLQALKTALEINDVRLTQGSTTTPPPFQSTSDQKICGCCAIGFCGWQGENLQTVGEVEQYFAETCFEADKRLGQPASCRYFLNWFDDSPREEMCQQLLKEVSLALAERIVTENDSTEFTLSPEVYAATYKAFINDDRAAITEEDPFMGTIII